LSVTGPAGPTLCNYACPERDGLAGIRLSIQLGVQAADGPVNKPFIEVPVRYRAPK
jgi:hypothetical protein